MGVPENATEEGGDKGITSVELVAAETKTAL